MVGGGHAGFYTAWHLEKKLKPDETAGSIEARHAAVSLRTHLPRSRVNDGKVTAIDHAHQRVTVRFSEGPDRDLDYDLIAVTAGAVTRTFPIPRGGRAGHRPQARGGGVSLRSVQHPRDAFVGAGALDVRR